MISSDSKGICGSVKLRKGREFSVITGHPWIFSGAVEELSSAAIADGSIVEVLSSKGNFLGLGFYNSRTSIAVRMFAPGKNFSATSDPLQIILANLEAAIRARAKWIPSDTNCMRLVNAEGDYLPGLIVDRYAEHLVIQVGTAGVEKCKPAIINSLLEHTKASSVFERSDSSSRSEEGLAETVAEIIGSVPDEVQVQEYNARLLVDIKRGQKTGFFIDQREMRNLVCSISKDKRVLNCFSYTGGFSVAAVLGGASRVVSVDSSESAINLCRKNVDLNLTGQDMHDAKCVNAFDYLGGTHERFDLVILDPPAFAKQRDHVRNALKAYRQINYSALKLINPGGILITSSCSNFVSQDDFEQEVLKVACESGRNVSIIGRHRHAADHPVAAAHPQGAYLKSLILLIN